MKRDACALLCLAGLVFLPAMAAEVVPPEEAGNLTVAKSGTDVVLNWNAVSTDILGNPETVIHYRMYRGGAPDFVPDKIGETNVLATPPGIAFTDAGALATPQSYFYLVSAVDDSGNEGNTRPSKVLNAPTLNGSFSTTAASLDWAGALPPEWIGGYRIIWGTSTSSYVDQRDVGDVADTSIFPLNPNLTYFFANLVYDAELNVAPISNEVSGQLAGSPAGTEVCGRIETNATWTLANSPYIVTCNVEVYADTTPFLKVAPAVLTLEPGVVVKFDYDTTLTIGKGPDGGALVAQGTAASPIVFTANQTFPTPGNWAGLVFTDGADDGLTVLDHVAVEFGGRVYSSIRIDDASPTIRNTNVSGGLLHGFDLTGTTDLTLDNVTIHNMGSRGIQVASTANLALRNSTIEDVGEFGVYQLGSGGPTLEDSVIDHGVYLTQAAGDPVITGNTFTRYADMPSRVGADDVGDFLNQNAISGSDSTSSLEIIGERISADANWADPGFPLTVVSGVVQPYGNPSVPVTLTIGAGTELRFRLSTRLHVGTTTGLGALVAVGSAAEPIVFTAEEQASPAPGAWQSIYFDNGTVDATSRLEHCRVEYGGQSFSGMINLVSASPTIRNCIVRHSNNAGVYGSGDSSPTVENNQFEGNAAFDLHLNGANDAVVRDNVFSHSVRFDNAGGTYTVTDNTFNGYDDDAFNVRVGAHAVAALDTNTFNGAGTSSTVEILGETLTTDALWTNLGFPYVLQSALLYVAGDPTTAATLTIEPGVTIRFNLSTGLFIGSGTNRGALVAAGTPADPIIFTTNNAAPAPGQWRSIYFAAATDSATSILEHCVVEYGGQSDLGNIATYGSSPTIRNCTIHDSSGSGIRGSAGPSPRIEDNVLYANANFDIRIAGVSDAIVTGNQLSGSVFFDTGGGMHSVTGNTFDGYNDPAFNLRVGAHAVAALGSNTFNGTGADSKVEILGETLTSDASWPNLGFPYAVLATVIMARDTNSPSTLVLAPGTTLRFALSAGLQIGSGAAQGALVAVGTPTEPIVFTTNDPSPAAGQWRGVYFDNGTIDATSILAHCTVEYAGYTYTSNVRLVSASPTIRNCAIRNGSGYGIYATGDSSPLVQDNFFDANVNFDAYFGAASDVTLTGNTFNSSAYFYAAGNQYSVTGNTFENYNDPTKNLRVGAHAVGELGTNTFNGTGADSLVEVLTETLSDDAAWADLGFPYAILGVVTVARDTVDPATLTIAPGTTLRFAASTRLAIGTNTNKGALVAVGTAVDPILFTAHNETPAPGQWQGLYFDNATDDESSVVEHATVEYAGQSYTTGIRLVGASPTVRNCTFRDSSGYGIYGTSNSSPVVEDNTFVDNANFDVFLSGGSDASLTGNNFTHAARFDSAVGQPVVQDNTFDGYNGTYVLRVPADSVTDLTGNVFNDTDGTSIIEVLGETLTGIHQWTDLGLPYALLTTNLTVAESATVAARLTLDPGVILRFQLGRRLVVGASNTQGELIAVGTPADPITFTSNETVPVAGDWAGLLFNNGTTLDSALDHVVIEYAGRSGSAGVWASSADIPVSNALIRDSGNYGVYAASSAPPLTNVQIENTANYGIYLASGVAGKTTTISGCTITNPTGYGIYITGGYDDVITGNTIDNGIYVTSATGHQVVQDNILNNYAGYPLHIGAGSIGSLTGNTFNDTAIDSSIEILGERVTESATWAKLPVPYELVSSIVYFAGTPTQAAVLTIDPGTTIMGATSTRLQIGYSSSLGGLLAVGTPAEPIIFTTADPAPAPGQWNGVYFDNATVDAISVLAHCVVEYAGQSVTGNIYVSNSSPVIRNCTVRHGLSNGIGIASASPTIEFNDIVDNTLYGVNVLYSSSAPQVHHNNLTGNTSGALNRASGSTVDARMNWYGDASGPSGLGPGTGQPVLGVVAYSPWLGTPYSQDNYFSDMFFSTPTFMPGSFTRFFGQLAQDSTWTLQIIDTGDAIVRTIGGSGPEMTVDWDGTDDSVVALPDGPYRFRFDATAIATADVAAPLFGMLELDQTYAVGEMESPDHLQTVGIGTIITPTGSADGTNFTDYVLQYGTGLFPTAYSTVVSRTVPVAGGTLGAWDTTGRTLGIYALRLLVNNDLGEQTIVNLGSYVLSVNTLGVDRAAFSPNGDGSVDEVTATATLSTEGNWTLDVVQVATTNTVRTFTGTGTNVVQTWDGTLNNGVTVAAEGDYRFDLSAVRDGGTAINSSTNTALDLTPPTAAITDPLDDAEIYGTVAVIGDAYDPDDRFMNYVLELGVGSAPLSYTTVGTANLPVTADLLATWVTNDTEALDPVSNGLYQLRLTANDTAGNQTEATRQISLDNLILGNVGVPATTVNPSAGETIPVQFSISKDADVTMTIHAEPDGEAGPVLNTYSGTFAAGTHTLTWDGTETATGEVVPDEAYVYILDADAGSGRTDRFAPTGGRAVGSGSGSPDPTYNPYTNDFWQMVYNNSSPSRVTMQATPTGQTVFDVFTMVPYEKGAFLFVWDGRDPTGQIIDVESYVYFPAPTTLRPNYVIATGDTPKVSEQHSDPYLMNLTYGQITQLRYTLERDADISVKILPPGIADPDDPSAIVLVDAVPTGAGSYEIEWDGLNQGDPNGNLAEVVEEGPYTFVIQALNTDSGTTTVTRGVINVFR